MAKCTFCGDAKENVNTRNIGGYEILETCKECTEEILKEFITSCDRCQRELNQMKGEDIYLEKLKLVLCEDCFRNGGYKVA
ncbi:hypothetical protein [Heyndrickxia sporothermodurans]|uniref:hypothetical protein n=1 Tax=Heyndrickxia sporothermodurans TaxID=46224 RepID=UPI000D3B0446|nr:hypothetical protein [Heyndrickxia sporothermodurans]PTY89739.1 hypothetical protein B5V90_07420 [Heyndrickxia sporothermodurans]